MEGKPPSTSPVSVMDRPRIATSSRPPSPGSGALLAAPMLLMLTLLTLIFGAESLGSGSLRSSVDLVAVAGIGLSVAWASVRFMRAVFR